MEIEARKKFRLDKQRDFWTLYSNPEITAEDGEIFKVRYYQDGRFFGVGGVYVPVVAPANLLPKQAQSEVKNIGGYKPILTEEELNGQDVLQQIREEREALAREKAEFEKTKTVGKTEEPKETEKAAETAGESAGEAAGDQGTESASEKASEKVEEPAKDEKKVFQCPHCPKKYKVERYYKEHLKTHES